jgi:hypothetical protein
MTTERTSEEAYDRARPWWLAPLWLREELTARREDLKRVRDAYDKLTNKSTDYARSMAALIEARSAMVEIAIAKLKEVER